MEFKVLYENGETKRYSMNAFEDMIKKRLSDIISINPEYGDAEDVFIKIQAD